MQGLSQAAQQIQSYGRGRDTMLAHIAPDEAEFIDAIQGGRRVNPATGLPEYGLFGKILKAVVRVGGAVGGFMVGGPAGAAAGSAAATKLTGGSWKDALKAGAMSGVGSYATQGLTGGGWNALGKNSMLSGMGSAATSQAAQAGPASTMSLGSGAGLGGVDLPAGLSSVAAPAAAPTGLAGMLAPIGGLPGAAAGLGGLSAPLGKWSGESPEMPESNPINLNVKPFNRGYRSPQVDLTNYAERPGGIQFFDNVNPEPEYLARGGAIRRYNVGGGVMPMQQPGGGLGGLGGLRNPGIPSQIESPHLDDPMALKQQAMDNSPASQRAKIRQAAMIGYVNAKDGGAIRGPGTETSDDIPAMLSDGEHVIDAATVRAAGGHKAIERFKQKARARAGVKNPKKPPAFQGNK